MGFGGRRPSARSYGRPPTAFGVMAPYGIHAPHCSLVYRYITGQDNAGARRVRYPASDVVFSSSVTCGGLQVRCLWRPRVRRPVGLCLCPSIAPDARVSVARALRGNAVRVTR